MKFRRGKIKVRASPRKRVPTPKDATPLYAEGVHRLDGLADDEVDNFLEDHPKIIPLFDIDIVEAVRPYVSEPTEGDQDVGREPGLKSVEELRHAREALKCELAISQRVKASTLEDVNLESPDALRTVKIAKDLAENDRTALITLTKYQDVFTWSYNDMKGLDPQY